MKNTHLRENRKKLIIYMCSSFVGMLFISLIIYQYNIGWFLSSILFAIPSALFFVFYSDYPRTFIDCPECGKKVLLYEDWQCNHCGEHQGQKRYVDFSCLKCGRLTTSIICEHCEGEFEI